MKLILAFTKVCLGITLVISGVHFLPKQAWSQQLCVVTGCITDADCLAFNCPGCYSCIGAPGSCQPDPGKCDDGNACTQDECLPPNAPFFPDLFTPQGCIHTSLALPPPLDPNLATECYLCEFDGNGICEPASGETCANSSDCRDPESAACATPATPQACNTQNIAIFGDPFRLDACSDGDVCTDNLCAVAGGPVACDNPPLDCEQFFADGCCPNANCTPPRPEDQGVCSDADPNFQICDPDCWPAPVCGDEFVQPPGETCDDGLPGADAGIRPDGVTPVSKTDCRDPNATNPCTYCGDGILDSPSEQCDGTDLGACTTCSGNCTCGIIPPTGLCIFGSGFGSGENAPVCGQCSLNKNAVEAPGSIGVWSLMAFAFFTASMVLRRRAGR